MRTYCVVFKLGAGTAISSYHNAETIGEVLADIAANRLGLDPYDPCALVTVTDLGECLSLFETEALAVA